MLERNDTLSPAEQYQKRKAEFDTHIETNHRAFIKSQAATEILSFLVEGRHKLEKLESKMEKNLNKQSTFLSGFFSSRNKVLPSSQVKDLPPALQAEFETAKQLLLDISSAVVRGADTNKFAQAASSQQYYFKRDLEKLKEGGRLDKHWNNANESDLYAEEKSARKLLGSIKNEKILAILVDLHQDMDMFPLIVTKFLETTDKRISDKVEKDVDNAYKDFIKTPVGEYIHLLIHFNEKAKQFENDGMPPTDINKKLKPLFNQTQIAERKLSPTELAQASQIVKLGLEEISKLDILLAALPTEKYSELLQRINRGIALETDDSATPSKRYSR
jgi:hypothetical protein